MKAAFSPDGTRVVTASWDKTARVWDARSGQPLTPLLEHQDLVENVSFSPNGAWVVTASADHTVRIWDAVSGKPISPPLEHQGAVSSAELSPDGARLISASTDHTARVWQVPLASGTLAEWRAIVDRTSPYQLTDGVLLLRHRDTEAAPAPSSTTSAP